MGQARSRPEHTRLTAALAAAFAVLALLLAAPAAGAKTMVVQPDGKVVLGGYANPGFAGLVRFNADGSLDGSFGAAGVVVDHRLQPVSSLALQPDGALLVAAPRLGSGWPTSQLGRYLASGSPDTGFGDGGATQSTFEQGLGAQPAGIVVRGDGSIVLAANHCCFKFGPSSASLEGFAASGAYGGVLWRLLGTETAYPGQSASLQDLLALPDGSLVGVGTASRQLPAGGIESGLALVHFVPGQGGFDPGFGKGEGIVIGPPVSNAFGAALDQGKVLVAGNTGYLRTASSQPLLARFDDEGVPDPSFGNGGFVSLPVAGSVSSWSNEVAVAADGSIFAVGTSFTGFKPDFDYQPCAGCSQAFVAKLTPAGALDPSFGEAGIVRLGGGAVPAMSGEDVSVLSDGRVLVSGSGEGEARPFVLARLTPTGQLDSSFGNGGVATTGICQGTNRRLQDNGCLPKARVSLQTRNLGGRKPYVRLRVRPNVDWARIRSVQLVLPRALRVNQKRVEKHAGFKASIPGNTVLDAKPHPHSINIVSLGYSTAVAATLWRHALTATGPRRPGKRLAFKVVVKFGEPGRDEGQEAIALKRRG